MGNIKRIDLVEAIDLKQGETFIETNKENLKPGVIGIVKTVGGRVGIKNRNERVYDDAFWTALLNQEEFVFDVKNRRMFGETDHPEEVFASVGRISHITTKVWKEGDTIWLENEILDTPGGRIIKTLLEAQCLVGISSRGSGDCEYIEEESGGVYERILPEGFIMKGWDFVVEPSTINGYVKAITDKGQREKFVKESQCMLNYNKTMPGIPRTNQKEAAAPIINRLKKTITEMTNVLTEKDTEVLGLKTELKESREVSEAVLAKVGGLREEFNQTIYDLKNKVVLQEQEMNGLKSENNSLKESLNNGMNNELNKELIQENKDLLLKQQEKDSKLKEAIEENTELKERLRILEIKLNIRRKFKQSSKSIPFEQEIKEEAFVPELPVRTHKIFIN